MPLCSDNIKTKLYANDIMLVCGYKRFCELSNIVRMQIKLTKTLCSQFNIVD